MRGSEFEFDGGNFLYYDFNKTTINRGGSYIDSPKWLKDKKSTINPKNNDDKCFQYAVTLALNLDKIKKDQQRVSKIKPVIEKYNWEDIDFPSTGKDWKKFECNNDMYSIFTHCSFDKSKNKLNYYRGKDCMKKFSKDLREHVSKIIDYEKKKMIPLTTQEKVYHNKQKICYM